MTVDDNSSPEQQPAAGSGPQLPILNQPSTRRTALKAVGAALGLAAFGTAISPLWSIPENVSVEEFLQQHYKELTDDDKRKVFERLEAEAKANYGADVIDFRPETDSRRPFWLRHQPQQMQRQWRMHGSMQQGEQPPPGRRPVVHPRVGNVKGLDGYGTRHNDLRPHGSAGRQVLHAGAVPAMR